MDIIMLVFLAWLFGGGSKGAPSGGGVPPPFPGPAPIPNVPPTAPPVPAPAPAPAATYVIKSGDTPFGLAQRFTGQGKRWTELRPPNPNLKTVQTRDPNTGAVVATHLVPFDPGQVLNLPASWPPTA